MLIHYKHLNAWLRVFYVNTGWFFLHKRSPEVDNSLAVPGTTPLSLLLLLAKFALHSREGGEKWVPTYYQVNKNASGKAISIAAWPQWDHRVGPSAKEAGKGGKRIVRGIEQSLSITWEQAQNWGPLNEEEEGIPKLIFSPSWSWSSGQQGLSSHCPKHSLCSTSSFYLCSIYLEHSLPPHHHHQFLPNPIHPSWLCSYSIYSITHYSPQKCLPWIHTFFIHSFIYIQYSLISNSYLQWVLRSGTFNYLISLPYEYCKTRKGQQANYKDCSKPDQ